MGAHVSASDFELTDAQRADALWSRGRDLLLDAPDARAVLVRNEDRDWFRSPPMLPELQEVSARVYRLIVALAPRAPWACQACRNRRSPHGTLVYDIQGKDGRWRAYNPDATVHPHRRPRR